MPRTPNRSANKAQYVSTGTRLKTTHVHNNYTHTSYAPGRIRKNQTTI